MTLQRLKWLEHFPIAMFTITMGLSGLAMALRAAEPVLGLTGVLSTAVFGLTLVLFFSFLVLYLIKLASCVRSVADEWNHPVQLALFPSMSISLLLLSALMLDSWAGLAHLMWLAGMVLQGVLTLAVVSGWISARAFQHGHLNPAWFIPTVGNVIVSFAGVPLGYIEISWFFISAGLMFWLILVSLVMNRLIFHDPLPERLQPTLVVLIAPPALIFLAWVGLMGRVDAFAHILLNVTYLFVLIVAMQLPRMLKLPFALTFWALSFPIAAATSASFTYAAATDSIPHQVIGLGLLFALCVIISFLAFHTIRLVISGQLFQPD
ncbi:SLAC1 anion channel family protein [Roseovarius sp. EL26]|uniref:SLAC1 anion channel family protein n=1 Tax=Roseovarius sp. EL26 TaxID=2126672 RepID=UPI000EA261C1|nr:SLAC1 anion channel family protein [Roseovarius sp. EL26]